VQTRQEVLDSRQPLPEEKHVPVVGDSQSREYQRFIALMKRVAKTRKRKKAARRHRRKMARTHRRYRR